MRVMVTGGTGFTGSALVKRLLDESYQVIAIDNKEGLKTDEIRNRGAEVVIGSVTDKSLVKEYMQGVDIVLHLAAAFRELNVPDNYYYEVNVEGTNNVLEAAFEANVKKFIYCSTCGVHGNIDDPPGGEDSPIQPADYYQRTKYEAEPIVNEYFKKGMASVILRPAATYGPGDPERFYMIFKRVSKGQFPIFGHGRTLYHPLYIDNLIDAFMLAMQDGIGNGEAYLIADEEFIDIEHLVGKVAKALEVKVKTPHYPIWPLIVAGHLCEKICRPFRISPPIFPRRVDWYRQNRAFKIDKAKNELGYQPRVGLDEGLRYTAEWYIREGYLKNANL